MSGESELGEKKAFHNSSEKILNNSELFVKLIGNSERKWYNYGSFFPFNRSMEDIYFIKLF